MARPVDQTISRDPALFWWILLPITVVMVVTGILRHYLTVLLQSTPKPQPIKKLRETRSLLHGVNLRTNAPTLPPAVYKARRDDLVTKFKDGAFLADPESRGKAKGNPMADPNAMEGMMGMMKNNVAMMVPQTLIMGWINAFFAGFVIMKLPFPLTPQFKAMLQSGVGTRDLDVRWVSSLSWYFLTLFGLAPVYQLILGSNEAANQMSQQMAQMNPGAGANMFGGDQDSDKHFKAEAENLEVFEPQWVLINYYPFPGATLDFVSVAFNDEQPGTGKIRKPPGSLAKPRINGPTRKDLTTIVSSIRSSNLGSSNALFES